MSNALVINPNEFHFYYVWGLRYKYLFFRGCVPTLIKIYRF